MDLHRRRFTLSASAFVAACLFTWSALAAQPAMGGAKRKANELKPKDEPAKPEKKSEGLVVFGMGPDEKAHFEVEPASKRNVMKFESKAPKETIESKVNKVSGSLDFNPRKMDAIEGKFSVAWKDVDTGNPMRNGHMMHPPWIDASKYPDVVFTVTGIENLTCKEKPIKTINATLVGKMAMNGKEKEMKIPVTLSYLESSSTPKKSEAPRDMLGIRTKKFKVALADFDIKGKGVGEKVATEQEFTMVSLMLTGPEHKAEKKAAAPKAPPRKPLSGG